MNRSPLAEAQRKVTQSETMYKRLLEKQAAARTAYEAKIDRLRTAHAELLQEAGK